MERELVEFGIPFELCADFDITEGLRVSETEMLMFLNQILEIHCLKVEKGYVDVRFTCRESETEFTYRVESLHEIDEWFPLPATDVSKN